MRSEVIPAASHREVAGPPALQLEAAVGGQRQVGAVGQQAQEGGAAEHAQHAAHGVLVVARRARHRALRHPGPRHALVAALLRGPAALPQHVGLLQRVQQPLAARRQQHVAQAHLAGALHLRLHLRAHARAQVRRLHPLVQQHLRRPHTIMLHSISYRM